MTINIDELEAHVRELYFNEGEESPSGYVPMDPSSLLEILVRVRTAESDRDVLATQAGSLRDHLFTCQHHACYSIGEAEALARQLSMIREVANAGLAEQRASPLDRWVATKQAVALQAQAAEMVDAGDRQRLLERAAELLQHLPAEGPAIPECPE